MSGDAQYIGRISLFMWGYHEYSGVFGTLEGIMSTSEDTMSALWGV